MVTKSPEIGEQKSLAQGRMAQVPRVLRAGPVWEPVGTASIMIQVQLVNE